MTDTNNMPIDLSSLMRQQSGGRIILQNTENNYGEVNFIKHYGNASTVADISDVEIAKAIRATLAAVKENGSKLMNDKAQWFAIKCVLVFYCNYPKSTPQFCRKMETIGIMDVVPECNVASINQAGKTMPKLVTSKPTDWSLYKDFGSPYEKQYEVAMSFMRRLGIVQ